MQCTSESLIIEEFRGSQCSHFDTAHEQELDYGRVWGSKRSDFDTAHK